MLLCVIEKSQTMEIINLVTVRELQASDLNFILSSSIKSIQSHASKLYPATPVRELYEHLEKIILCAFAMPNYSILIACHKDDSDHIIGYLMVDQSKNHVFLQYTKYAFRKLGVQKHVLLPLLVSIESPITYEFATKEAVKLSKKLPVIVKSLFTEQLLEYYLKAEKK